MRREGLKEKKLIAANQNFKAEEFWRNQLAGQVPKSHFPYCSNRGSLPPSAMETVIFKPEGESLNRLMEQCQHSDYKLHILLTTVLALLVRFYSYPRARRLLLATPIYNPGAEGDFVNTLLPLLLEVDNDLTVKELLGLVGKTMVEASNHQNFPMEILFERLELPLSPAGQPLVDVALLLTNLQDPLHLHGLYYSTLFSFTRQDDGLVGELRCRADIYDRTLAENITRHFLHLLAQITLDLGIKVSHLHLLPAREETQLLENFNKPPTAAPHREIPGQDVSLHRLFEIQTENNPGKIALADQDRQLTYGELNRRANCLAALLVSRGVKAGTPVAAAVEPCGESIIGMMAIFKAGGLYLPVSPVGPTESNAKIVLENKVELLLARRHLRETPNNLFNAFLPDNIIFPDDEAHYDGSPPNPEIKGIHANSPACITYTSGTTGIPRGILMTHGNIAHLVTRLVNALANLYATPHHLHIALVTLFMSGSSLKQLFGALLTGHTLVLYPHSSEPTAKDLCRFYLQEQVDISDGAPFHLDLLLDAPAEDLSRLPVNAFLLGGEVLLPKTLADFWQKTKPANPAVINIFSTTGAGDAVTSYRITRENLHCWGSIPLGLPLPGVRVYILGSDGQLQPPGAPGELYIGGAGVSPGYFNQPELTAEEFCLRRPGGAPFEKTAPPGPPGKNFLLEQTPPGKKSYRFYRSCKFRKFRRFYIYRTGDLARWLPDGNIELIGRNNDVSEIEYPLRQHNDIHEVLIIKPTQSSHFSAGDVPPGDRHLAYLISEKALDIPALNRYISAKASRLYPLEFIKVTRLPLTANFKIDRKQWLGPPTEATPRIIPPRNSLERKLVKLWAKVLEIEESRISIDANFLELNGNSLKTIMLISEIFKEFEVRIPLAEVFNAPTITGLASYIKNASGSAYFSLEPVETREYYLLSSAQQRLFFIQEMDPANIGYNLSQTTPLDFAVDIDKIRETFKKIIKRHEILATSFHLIENKPVQRIHREIDFQVELQEAKTGIKEIINGFIRPFNLEQAPLLRMGLIKLAAEKYVLLLDIHHIVTDATSGTILVQDFFALYNGEQPAPLKIHYKDYAVWQHSEDCRQEIKRQEAFWLEKFAGEIPVLKLPLDYPRPTEQSFTGDMLMFTLGPQTATRTKALAKQENTTLFMLFLSIYYLFLAKITGQTDIVIGTGTAGRLHPDLENTMGIFINLIALRLTSNDHLTFREFLREITQSALADFENQEYQFDRLVDQVVKNKDRSRNPLFDVGFTFNTRDFSSAYVSRLGAGEYENEIKTAKFDLTLTGEEGEDDLYFFFEYCTDLFKKSKIQRFADYFRDIVNGVTIDSDIRLDRIDIVSHGLSGLETDISREVEGDFEL